MKGMVIVGSEAPITIRNARPIMRRSSGKKHFKQSNKQPSQPSNHAVMSLKVDGSTLTFDPRCRHFPTWPRCLLDQPSRIDSISRALTLWSYHSTLLCSMWRFVYRLEVIVEG